MDYQELHPELERWAIFRALPPLMKFEKGYVGLMNDMRDGLVQVPKFTQIVNPPTLLTYYLTLPQWVREATIITNAFYALEYHQTRTSIRNKELAMNYMASFLRPIEGKLLDVIKDVAGAKKLRLNVELGKKMVNDIRFWEFDYTELGEMTGDEENEAEKKAAKKFAKSLDDDPETRSLADTLFETLTDEYREKERMKIMDEEQSIADF